jgi:hypothetical protein
MASGGSRRSGFTAQEVPGVEKDAVHRGPRSIPLAPHDSLQFNEFFGPGIQRVVIGVSLAPGLGDEAVTSSMSFVVH